MKRAALGLGLWAVGLAASGCAKAPPNLPAPGLDATRVLQQDISAAVSGPGVRRATWGIAVESLTGNDRLIALNPGMLLVPASVAKLVSVAAAVDAVGWDYRFETSLRATGPIIDGVLEGDLLVVGSGDPSIGGRGGDDLAGWTDALTMSGLRRIEGRVIGDDDGVEEPRPGAMWAWDDLGYTTGALFGALNFAENVLTIAVAPGMLAGAPTSVTLAADGDRPLINRSVTGAAGSPQLLWPEQRPGEPQLTIAGSMPVGAPPATLRVSAGNPTTWFARALRRRLIAAGIDVTGDAIDMDDLPVPVDRTAAHVLYAYRSHPLAEIARPLLKDSINLYGEAVLRLSTGATGGRTNDDALNAVRQRLGTWGLAADGLQVVDGSGLSRRDVIAADTLVGVLRRMFDPDGRSPWMTGLPVAGRDGTLESRMKGTTAEGNVQAKSGTMSNIRSLAGYVRTRDGEPLAFAIMVNNFEGTGTQAIAAIDSIAVRLASFSRR